MSSEPIAPDSSASSASSSGTYTVARFLRLLVVAAPLAVAAVAATVGPSWFSAQPREFRRTAIETFLRGLSVVHGALLLASIAGTPLFGWLALAAWRKKARRPGVERGFLLGVSCLVALLGLEAGATAWRVWMHRLPGLPTAFAASPPGEYRIVVLGGSSALGEPYRPWLSVGQIVAWKLQQAVPARKFVCEILAWLGDSLEKQHLKLAGLRQRPDAVIIYSGHNEFAARFGEERDAGLAEEPSGWLMRPLYEAAANSPFRRLCREIVNRNRIDAPPLSGRHHLIDPPVCSPSESDEIVTDFSRRLEAIVSYCDQIGALPILIVPPANEARYEPSRSTLPSSVLAAERERLVREFATARAGESRDPETSTARYESILARHPGFAEAHFRLAGLLERQGRFDEAASHYLTALDQDGLPIRCPAPFRAAYADVASRHPRSILIDGSRELRAVSPNGLLGDEMIQDTHHPTLRGYVTLAGAVLRELARRRTFDLLSTIELPLDCGECADQFGMGADAWATVCDRTSEHYRRVAGYRYDPAERLDKSRRYAEAARKIRAGIPIEDFGLPGIAFSASSIPPGTSSTTSFMTASATSLPRQTRATAIGSSLLGWSMIRRWGSIMIVALRGDRPGASR